MVGNKGLDLRGTDDRALTVAAGDADLFTYVFRADDPVIESPRPYFHPIRTLGGRLVTIFRPHDHVWHKGLSWSLPDVGGENFWGGPTYVHGRGYVQLPNNGEMRHERFTARSVAADSVHFGHELTWITQNKRVVFDEHRQISVRVADSIPAWALVFDTTMTNVSGGTLALGSPTTAGRENAGYGGLFWRGPRSFTGGTIHTGLASGGDEIRGTTEEWMGFSGRHDEVDGRSTIVMVDDPANTRARPQWFARSAQYAGLCPAPFFSTELEAEAAEQLHFRYAVVIADGGAEPHEAASLADWGRELLLRSVPAAK